MIILIILGILIIFYLSTVIYGLFVLNKLECGHHIRCKRCKHYRTYHVDADAFGEFRTYCKKCKYFCRSYYEKYKEDKHHG